MKYMTVKDVLDYVNEVKDNTFSRKTKLIWLNELEYRVQTDVMLLAADSVQSVPDEDDHELLVPAPWHEIYYDYLFMKLSEHLEESSEQNNRAATFDKAFGRFMKWWADTYEPRSGKAVFKGYYLVGPPGEEGDPGERGESITGVRLEDGHLIVTLESGSEIDTGIVSKQFLSIAGGTMAGDIDMGRNAILFDDGDGIWRTDDEKIRIRAETGEGVLIGDGCISDILDVSGDTDATNKKYVDDSVKGVKQLVVTLSADSNGNIVADKTFAQIHAAAPNVVATDGTYQYHIDSVMDFMVAFRSPTDVGNTAAGYITFAVSSDNTWEYEDNHVEYALKEDLASLDERVEELEQHGTGGGIPDAPADGKQYARKDGDWSEVEGGGGSSNVYIGSVEPPTTGEYILWIDPEESSNVQNVAIEGA